MVTCLAEGGNLGGTRWQHLWHEWQHPVAAFTTKGRNPHSRNTPLLSLQGGRLLGAYLDVFYCPKNFETVANLILKCAEIIETIEED